MPNTSILSFSERYLFWAQKFRVPLGALAVSLFVLLMDPTPRLLLIGAIVGIGGILIRFWAAGYLHKARTLTTAGPYRYTRNPLYLGSFILLIGLAITGGSWIAGLVCILLFVLIYYPTMLREETELRQGFKENFDHYVAKVPRFFPRPTGFPSSDQSYCFQQALRNREYSAFFGFLTVLLLIGLKLYLKK
jgi:protein-S-isoprenylcysteine O-methyltransferase Ste14